MKFVDDDDDDHLLHATDLVTADNYHKQDAPLPRRAQRVRRA